MLRSSPSPRRGSRDEGRHGTPPAHRRFRAGPPILLVALCVLGLGAVAAAAAVLGPGATWSEPDAEVALPAPGDLTLDGVLSPEQQDALDRFDPDRPQCRPRGCEQWHLQLEEETDLIAVNGPWLVALDGSTLRVRSIDGSVPTEEHDVSWLQTRRVDGEQAGDPRRIDVAPDGTALLLWADLLVAINLDGNQHMSRPSRNSDSRYLEVRGDHVVVIGDLPPGTTTGWTNRRRVTGIDLRTGRTRWQRDDLIPRDLIDAGLAGTTGDGTVVLVDTADGSTLWTRETGPDSTVQVASGPWVVDGSRDGQRGAVLLDATSGEEVATRPESSLLTPVQPIGDLWVATWVDDRQRGGRGPRAVLVALDGAGQERWQVPLDPLLSGVCCPEAIPWRDGTVAIFQPDTPDDRWLIVDAATGARRDLPASDQPDLPEGGTTGRSFVPADAPGRLIKESLGLLSVLTADGSASLSTTGDIDVVSTDPLIVRQGRHVLRMAPVPAP